MYKFNFFGGEKKIDSNKNENLKAENEKLVKPKDELALQNSDLQRSTEKENAIFVPELKPFAEKVLGLMEIGKNLKEICNNLFSREKETATPEQIQLSDNAFAKFQKATNNLKIDEWHEELNNIVNNNDILIKLPSGNHSLVYTVMRQPIHENYSEENRIKVFEEDMSLMLLDRYCGALLVLIEDMKILAYNDISIPKEIDKIRETLRLQITKELGLKIKDVELLEKLNNNADLEVWDEVVSPLTQESERIVEVLSYGVGRDRVDNTKVIISK